MRLKTSSDVVELLHRTSSGNLFQTAAAEKKFAGYIVFFLLL